MVKAASILFRIVGPTGDKAETKGSISTKGGASLGALTTLTEGNPTVAPTSVCSHGAPTGHYKFILAERLVILTPNQGEVRTCGCVDLHDDHKFCGNTKHTIP